MVDKLIEGSKVGGGAGRWVNPSCLFVSDFWFKGLVQKWQRDGARSGGKKVEVGDNCMRRVKKADGKERGWTVFFFMRKTEPDRGKDRRYLENRGVKSSDPGHYPCFISEGSE